MFNFIKSLFCKKKEDLKLEKESPKPKYKVVEKEIEINVKKIVATVVTKDKEYSADFPDSIYFSPLERFSLVDGKFASVYEYFNVDIAHINKPVAVHCFGIKNDKPTLTIDLGKGYIEFQETGTGNTKIIPTEMIKEISSDCKPVPYKTEAVKYYALEKIKDETRKSD